MNYTSWVNKYRIEDAKALLTDKKHKKLKMEEVSDLVGFQTDSPFMRRSINTQVLRRESIS